ncbi:hypothetical protein [Halalkalibacter sp. APA_J-10(15)]|uniref:hypothetical protein n=1 Tax=Halalkalibacter sp. APA_J-10(15) TaxID=2933805 RepID=UPI001FF6E461|nr:hypothetical protein [Halalkalibacter sp. APA_J-10(15)]MCK0470398.1 hypothetical protein [Halalkalibacter sp. APA_J-10(15)]
MNQKVNQFITVLVAMVTVLVVGMVIVLVANHFGVSGEIILIIMIFAFGGWVCNKLNFFGASLRLLQESRKGVEKVIYTFFPMFEIITFKRMETIDKNIQELEQEKKKIYKALINSELDKKKNFAPVGIIFTIVVTAFFSVFNVYNNLYNNWMNNVISLSIDQRINFLELSGNSGEEISNSLLSDVFLVDPEFGEIISEVISKYLKGNLLFNLNVFLLVSGALILYYICYQLKYDRLSKLKCLFDQFD